MKAATSTSAAAGRALPFKRTAVSLVAARLLGSAGPAVDAGAVLPLRQCQRLLKQRLARLRLDLFPDLTGLRLCACWHEPADDLPPGGLPKANSPFPSGGLHASRLLPPVSCPRARQRPPGRVPERCKACLRKFWPQAWSGRRAEKRFTGLCGSTNYCAGVRVPDGHPVTLTVQQTAPASRARQRAFLRAVWLTRLIVHDLQATLEAREAFYEPSSTNLRVGHTSRLPQQPATCNLKPGHSHNQQIVQQMLDYIQQHYSRPLHLGDLASALNMNAAYLSHLFSTTTGGTFHHHLEQLRLARAKELLRDPLQRISEIACGVGYANPNYFRSAFKARLGVSPSAWRNRSSP